MSNRATRRESQDQLTYPEEKSNGECSMLIKVISSIISVSTTEWRGLKINMRKKAGLLEE
ncbi:TPA: hypothetical protein KRH38_002264 [Clostridioides difficile]|nr:hypothetical protein [Clostridioides difficile]